MLTYHSTDVRYCYMTPVQSACVVIHAGRPLSLAPKCLQHQGVATSPHSIVIHAGPPRMPARHDAPHSKQSPLNQFTDRARSIRPTARARQKRCIQTSGTAAAAAAAAGPPPGGWPRARHRLPRGFRAGFSMIPVSISARREITVQCNNV